MAVAKLWNGFFSVGGTDLSNHVRSLSVKHEAEALDKTAMSNATKTRIAGIKDWSVDVEFNQDFTGGSVDATLWPLVGGASAALVIRFDAGVKSPTNPEYTGNAILPSYAPIDGAHGSLATTKVTFQADGDLGRATS